MGQSVVEGVRHVAVVLVADSKEDSGLEDLDLLHRVQVWVPIVLALWKEQGGESELKGWPFLGVKVPVRS